MFGRNAKEGGTQSRRAGHTGDTDCQTRRLDTVSAETRLLPRPSPPAPCPPEAPPPPHPATIALLVRVCATAGVEAVVPVVDGCPELLEPLADACRQAGFIEAAQYLWYIANPMD